MTEDFTPHDSAWREPISREPGVEINEAGRIVATGWPHIRPELWPEVYRELQLAVDEQTRFEANLTRRFAPNILGSIRTPAGGVFNLGSMGLTEVMEEEIATAMRKSPYNLVEVCDVGGGNGIQIERGTMRWTNRHGAEHANRLRLRTTMTTLLNFNDDTLESRLRSGVIDDVVVTSIELPPDEFFGKFDLVVAQNSVFPWSKYPELATLDMCKMCKRGGVILATFPLKSQEVIGGSLDIRDYLSTTDLVEYEELERRRDRMVVRLRPSRR